ncbi:winged helix-turn-helix domain-containing protein [Parasphingorhabdus sp.]|uniref:winged helix-turn-helix domain-containing protein n=1 Tax=Parasphingorhabdus sp. TaxID=2709688 RepID=UPI0030035504
MNDADGEAFSLDAFEFSGVLAEPSALRLCSSSGESTLEPKVMALLVALTQRPQQLWRRRELLEAVWPNGLGSDEGLSRLVSLLRKSLKVDHDIDDVITTVPKLGYRLDATVTGHYAPRPDTDASGEEAGTDPAAGRRGKRTAPFAIIAAILVIAIAALAFAMMRNDDASAAGSESELADTQVSLAVLPIEYNTGSAERSFLAEGITRDIIAKLSRVQDIRIVPYSLARDFATEADAGNESLDVRYIVSGSLSEEGSNYRLRIDLTDRQTQTQIWSNGFTRPIEGFFDLQDQAIQEIATALFSEIEASEIQRVSSRDEFILDVYELIQRAEDERYRYGREPGLRIVELARRAIAADPDSQAAKTLLATQLVLNATSSFSVDRERDIAEARRLIGSLRQADPRNAEVLSVAGQLALYIDTDRSSARRLLSAALEINPNDAHTAAILGLAQCYGGEPDEGLALLRQSETRAPRERRASLWAWFRSGCFNSRGDFPSSRDAMADAIDRNPNNAHFYYALAFVECMENRPGVAHEHALEARRIDPHMTLDRYRGAVIGAGYSGSPGMSADRQFTKVATCLDE